MAGKAKRKRRPLLQRTALHALKSLVRNHPGAALSAAGAGLGYAARSIADDAKGAVAETAASIQSAMTPEPGERERPVRTLSRKECEDLLAGMSREDKAALRAFVERHRP